MSIIIGPRRAGATSARSTPVAPDDQDRHVPIQPPTPVSPPAPTGLSLDDLLAGLRFFGRLPFELRRPLTLDQADRILRRRLAERPAAFLALAERAIYRRPASPYWRLLDRAGCELGDLRRLVETDGLEAALGALLRRGVYLTIDELKGRRPVVRGSLSFTVDPRQLANPGVRLHIIARSGGSRSEGTPVPIDLAWVRARSVDDSLSLAARGGRDWVYGHWGSYGGGAIAHLVCYALFGATPARSFTPTDLAGPALHPRYRWSGRALRWSSRLAGRPLPPTRYASLADPSPVVDWLGEVLAAGRVPHLTGFASLAVRACQLAHQRGIDLTGARFSVTGEPLTAARRAEIEQTGALAIPAFGSMESGALGEGCAAPVAPDEVHHYHDLTAIIQPGPDGPPAELAPAALLLTSLHPAAPLILLNASLGDQAVLTERRCGCPLEALGWTTHLHTVRSFEKLTAAGMTFLDADVIRVLEEVLPARFGGRLTDYQLLERETPDGRSSLVLVAHPALGPLDASALGEAFLAALGDESDTARMMELFWREAGVLAVERRPPEATAAGKVHHLHRERPAERL